MLTAYAATAAADTNRRFCNGLIRHFQKGPPKEQRKIHADMPRSINGNSSKQQELSPPGATQQALFNAALKEENTANRNKIIREITDQNLLASLVRQGTYETDRTLALQQLSDQRLLFEIATDDHNIPKIKSIAEGKLDDIHLMTLIDYPRTTLSSQLNAASRIKDPDLLIRIIKGDAAYLRAVQLTAAGKLERTYPERFDDVEAVVAPLREGAAAECKRAAAAMAYTLKDGLEELTELFQYYPYLDRVKIQKVGQKIYDARIPLVNGVGGMHQLYALFKKHMPYGSELSHIWDGIGDWAD